LTKLGRLVQAKKIRSLEDIYLFSLPIKEHQIVEYFLTDLKDEVMKYSLSKSKVLPVSALVSVLTLLLVTKTAILVWAPRSVKKLPPLFEVPSLTPSFALSQFVVVTGVVVSALLTLFLAKFKERVALFASASFPLPEALDSSLLECPKKC